MLLLLGGIVIWMMAREVLQVGRAAIPQDHTPRPYYCARLTVVTDEMDGDIVEGMERALMRTLSAQGAMIVPWSTTDTADVNFMVKVYSSEDALDPWKCDAELHVWNHRGINVVVGQTISWSGENTDWDDLAKHLCDLITVRRINEIVIVTPNVPLENQPSAQPVPA